MPRGIPNVQSDTAEPVAMIAMKLERHYQPGGDYQVVGYHKPEVKRKDAAGREIVVSPEEFIEGEMAPPPYPGVGFDGKVWASTVIRLPEEEARRVQKQKIGIRDFD